MTASFKRIKDNKYSMLIDGVYFGVDFLVPEGYTMDDYKDSVEVWDYKEIKPCKNLVIELDNKPSEVKIYFDSRADVACTGDLILKISKSLAIQRNDNLVLSAKEGVSTVSFGTLGIKENQDTNIEFYPTPKGANSKNSPAAKDLASHKNSSTFEHNRRINYKLQDNFVSAELMSGKSQSKTPITIDFRSTYFSRVMHGDFNTKEKNSEIKFECDQAFLLYANVTLLGEAKDGPTFLRNRSKQEKGNKIVLDKCSLEFQSSTSIHTKAGALNIYFSGINHINSAEVVNISAGSYNDTDIESAVKTLSILGQNKIKGSHVSFSTSGEREESIIKNSKIIDCHIDDMQGNIVNNEIFNCLGKNIEIAKNAKIICDFNKPKTKRQFLIFNNLSLKEHTELAISNALEVENERTLTNCIVERGAFRIVDTGPYKINNTIFKDGGLALNFKGEAIIQNSIFEGKNDLRDIVGIDSCDFKNVSIRAKESTSISNEILRNEQIKDYISFSKEKTTNEKNELRGSDMASNDVEIL